MKKATLSFDPLGDEISELSLIDTMPQFNWIKYDTGEVMSTLDAAVILAARVSLGKDLTTYKKDKERLFSIVRRGHTSCLEQVQIKIKVTIPLPLATQWFRHRTWSYNALSRRYADDEDKKVEFYHINEWKKQSEQDKQGSGVTFEYKDNLKLRSMLQHFSQVGYTYYKEALEMGVTKEQARFFLPQNTYTTFQGSVSLHNLLKFLKLRNDKHAQEEIRKYAEIIEVYMLPRLCPLVMEAWSNVR